MSNGGPSDAREVSLAVFGKHPGWDDHIDDIGLTTPALISLKAALYTDGIGGNIDGGVWDAMDSSRLLTGFGHEFIWRRHDGPIIGRMWSSSDGKGRSKYPMVAAVHAPGLSLDAVRDVILPALAQLEAKCVESKDAAGVERAVADARRRVHTELTRYRAAAPDRATGGQIASLASAPPLGIGRTGFERALYEMDRELAAFRGDQRTSFIRRGNESASARHIRVKCAVPGLVDSARLWIGVLEAFIDPDILVLAICPSRGAWLDLIVGVPGSAQLACVRVNEKAMACADDVPYEIDGATKQKYAESIESWRRAGSSPLFAEAPRTRKDHSPMIRLAAIWGGVAIALAAVLWMALRG